MFTDFCNCFLRSDDATNIHFTFVGKRKNTVISANLSFNFIIRDVFFGTCQQIHASENTRKAKLILTFEIGRNTPFQNENVDGILSVFYQLRDVKLTCGMRDLRISLELTVDIKIKRRINTLEIEIVFLVCFFVQVKTSTVVPRGILVRNMRKHNGERISDIQILNMIVTVHLNTRGNGNRIRKFLIEFKILHVIMLLDLPRSVKRQKA